MGNTLPPERDREPSLAGRMLGSYRIVTELGAGGMGTVWYAEHVRIGRRVAIKILHPELSADPEPVGRFVREARAVNAIRHPNIVDITDIGDDDDLVYLVMELLEGETLGARLERDEQLPLATTLTMVKQIALALSAAHERGVVHRDLKPENIFLCAHADYPDRVKVLDFGIAKLAGPGVFGRGTRPGLVPQPHPGHGDRRADPLLGREPLRRALRRNPHPSSSTPRHRDRGPDRYARRAHLQHALHRSGPVLWSRAGLGVRRTVACRRRIERGGTP